MNNLHLSAEAQNDLMEIKAYIEEDLLNPSAALTTVSRITKSLRVLQNYAYAGALLSSIADIESDYRFIVSGNYISFYRACGTEQSTNHSTNLQTSFLPVSNIVSNQDLLNLNLFYLEIPYIY